MKHISTATQANIVESKHTTKRDSDGYRARVQISNIISHSSGLMKTAEGQIHQNLVRFRIQPEKRYQLFGNTGLKARYLFYFVIPSRHSRVLFVYTSKKKTALYSDKENIIQRRYEIEISLLFSDKRSQV
ncbi:hypothetical protein TNCT_602441 [Trichonephila clavata]|uniref:Uncharacterized protein n=1 Tax=Trichonephila clavata TaxID=2740835 RepID=A0A8X6GPP4_TRICU|nr:hypothetical protein TNCT_602441 [Trichonephila clavata]